MASCPLFVWVANRIRRRGIARDSGGDTSAEPVQTRSDPTKSPTIDKVEAGNTRDIAVDSTLKITTVTEHTIREVSTEMADSSTKPETKTLDVVVPPLPAASAPTTTTSDKPSPAPSTTDTKPAAPATPNKDGKPGKPGKDGKPAASNEKKMSGQEAKALKEAKKAEKQAKRAAAKAAGGPPAGSAVQEDGKKGGKSASVKSNESTLSKGAQKGQQAKGGKGTIAVVTKELDENTIVLPVKPSKQVSLFKHLYPGSPRPALISGAIGTETKGGMGVHPSIVALTIQLNDFVISGSNARTISMLLAFKDVIRDYTTPEGTTLTRDLVTHGLSPQIEALVKARPMCVAMKNAIRWLKLEIAHIDISMKDEEAKEELVERIDGFIQEKLTAAGKVISNSAAAKIRDGDVIVTYAKSSVVQQALLEAHSRGTKFKVIVIDSRPRFEGRNLARMLGLAGVDTSYALITSLAYLIRKATKVFLGAHSMLSNGYLTGRVGTALVAMMAKGLDIPVIVCAESIKFTDKVQIDSIVSNERAPEEELIIPGGELEKSQDVEGLQMLNLLYDVTPAGFIDMVITEYGSLPPSSVPVVYNLSKQ